MPDSPNMQLLFFQQLKAKLSPHLSLADEVAEQLNISQDSAYRRIRGEKPLAMDELVLLATRYKISIDALTQPDSDSYLFFGKLANATDHIFENWLENLLQQLQFMNSFGQKQMYYLAKDVPLMQQLLIPELTAFKSFFWRKSILHYDNLKGIKFSLQELPPQHWAMAQKIESVYNQIPSTDIWNIESINSTIRQIDFYRDAHAFADENDVAQLYTAILKLIDHIERQAEAGCKLSMAAPHTAGAPFQLFNNELILGDNTVLAVLDGLKLTFLNHSVINFVGTHNERFNAHMLDAIQNLIKKSTQLSVVGEKERIRFFNRIREKIKTAARL